MWYIFVSDVRKGKVVFESKCCTQLNLSKLQGKFMNGPAVIGTLKAAQVMQEKWLEMFIEQYENVSQQAFYIDVKQINFEKTN